MMNDPLLSLPSPHGRRSPGQSAPDDYDDFRLPKGMDADFETLDRFKSLARDLELGQDQAQRLVDFYSRQIQTMQSQWSNQTNGRSTDWKKQSRVDKELAAGGNFERNLGVARKAVERFGGRKLADALSETGAGNHPEILRCFYRIGKALSEDGFVAPTGKRRTKSYGETFYPEFNHEEL